jgi:hypothetical protein
MSLTLNPGLNTIHTVNFLTPLLLMMVHFRWRVHNLPSSDGIVIHLL